MKKLPRHTEPAGRPLDKTPRVAEAPHPALVELVRLLARDAARRARNGG